MVQRLITELGPIQNNINVTALAAILKIAVPKYEQQRHNGFTL